MVEPAIQMSADDVPPLASGGSALESVMTSAGIRGLAGGVAGLIWGGVGGRVAMRILFLTSDDRVRGLTSDDGFEIGVFSGATVFLLIFTAILGGLAGILYGLLRMVLRGPPWSIALGIAIAAAAGGGGGAIVQSHGIDFRVLEPLWLAVGLFLFIPAAWAVTVVPVTERLLRPGAVFAVLPSHINKRYWGTAGSTIGWLILVVIAGLGLANLARDLANLT